MATLQPTFPELGRIRLGEKVPTKDGKHTRPARLDKFRLTSDNKPRLEYAKSLGWGEEVREWKDAPTQPQWELYCAIEELTVVVPQLAAFSQYDEIWAPVEYQDERTKKKYKSTECVYRCDGVQVLKVINAGLGEDDVAIEEGMPCQCSRFVEPPSTYTRVNFFLPEIPGFGVWRLQTQSYYAGRELQGLVQMLEAASQQSQYVPCTLSIQQRKDRHQGQTRVFPVPVLQPQQLTMGHLLGMAPSTPQIGPSDDDVYLPAPKPQSDVAQAMQGNAYEEQKAIKRQQIQQRAEQYGVWPRFVPWCQRYLPERASLKACVMAELDMILDHLDTHQEQSFVLDVEANEAPTSDNPSDVVAQAMLVDTSEAEQASERPF